MSDRMRCLSAAAACLLVASLISGCRGSTNDGGGLGGSDQFLTENGLQLRVPADQVAGLLPQAYTLIEQALPKATYVGDATGEVAGSAHDGLDVIWQPNGQRDTLMPPKAAAERIYAVVVVLDPYLSGSDPLARISFMTRSQANAWSTDGNFDPTKVIQPPALPTYVYRLPRATGSELIDLFYVHLSATPSS